MYTTKDLIGLRYYTDDQESELRKIEDALRYYLFGEHIWVKCAYDQVWSHKYQSEEEHRESDFVINYELYETEKDRDTERNGLGGFDGEVHELFYLKGNGDYIVITEI